MAQAAFEKPSPLEATALDAQITEAFSGTSRLWIPATLGVVTFFDSWDSIAIATVIPSLLQEWHLKLPQVGILISAGYAGQLVGALVFGNLASRRGRMPIFILCTLIMIGMAALCSIAPGYSWLLVGRVLQGFGVGGAMPVIIAYLNEIAPAQSRGRYIAIFQWVTAVGFVAASALSVIIVPNLGWRWMFGLGVLPLTVLPFLFFVPESPRWLASVGRGADAVRILAKLTGRRDDAADRVMLQEMAATALPKKIHPMELFKGATRRPVAILSALWFLTALLSYGLTTWLPSIYRTVYHMPIDKALASSAIPSLFFLVVPIVVALLIDRVGRRPLACISLMMGAVTFAAITLISTPSIPMLILLTSVGQTGINIAFMVLWSYSGELFATNMRTQAIGWASSCARFASMVTPVLIGAILAATGSVAVIFLLLSACAAIAALIWFFLCPETKGLRLDTGYPEKAI